MRPSVPYCDNCCREAPTLAGRYLKPDDGPYDRTWTVSLCSECVVLLDSFDIEGLAARRGVHAGVTVVERNPREIR